MDDSSNQPARILLPLACRLLRMSRDQVILRINRRDLDGGQDEDFGRWFVVVDERFRSLVSAAEAEQAEAV